MKKMLLLISVAILVVAGGLDNAYAQAQQRPMKYRGIFGVGVEGGWGNENTTDVQYGWNNPALSVDVQAGVGIDKYGEVLVRYEYQTIWNGDLTAPACGYTTMFNGRNWFSFIYRYNILGYKLVSPYVEAGPMLGWATFWQTDGGGCAPDEWSICNTFAVGLKAGAGLSINPTRWLRISFAFNYTIGWTAYPAANQVDTAWRSSQYPVFGVFIDLLLIPTSRNTVGLPYQRTEPYSIEQDVSDTWSY
jgi:opacity protein-like surface antigen